MRMFHGTVDRFLPSIRESGLRPIAGNAWRIAWADGGRELRDVEEVDGVYLTGSERHAIEYAETRVRYFAAKPGGTFPMFDCPDFILVKDQDTEVVRVTPILIVVEIEDEDDNLEDDPRDSSAKKYRGSIPPTKIVEVRTLSKRIKEDSSLYPNSDMMSDVNAAIFSKLSALFEELG